MTYTLVIDAEVDGYFHLDDGTLVRRTVHERLTVPSAETKQRALTAWVERLQAEGYALAEGRGRLTQLVSQRIRR
jgi:hypothetical protein